MNKNDGGASSVEVIEMPIDLIKPYWRNPRFNDETIPALKKSIERFGFIVPLVVDTEQVIITGHARYKALLQLGVKEVPVIISDMGHEKHQEFRIMDNRIQDISKWDYDSLTAELKDIFEGTDLGEYFAGTLDNVLDISGIMGASPIGDKEFLDGNPVTVVHEDDGDGPTCPYCDTPLTKDNIVTEEEA